MTIWWPEIPIWELLLRALLVYFILLLVIRFSGKRDIGEMSSSDLLLLLLISAGVHTSITGADKSVFGGIFAALALIGANFILNHFAFKSKTFEKFLKGEPEIIINQGKPQHKIMKRHRLTEMQLMIAIRKEQAEHFDQVRLAILETDGEISVFKY